MFSQFWITLVLLLFFDVAEYSSLKHTGKPKMLDTVSKFWVP